MRINYSKISNVEVCGIDTEDYPDFCDAYISYADYHGEEMSEEMLKALNEDRDYVYNQTINTLY